MSKSKQIMKLPPISTDPPERPAATSKTPTPKNGAYKLKKSRTPKKSKSRRGSSRQQKKKPERIKRIAVSIGNYADAPPTPRLQLADAMESFQVMEELRARNFVPTGFFEDDKNALQEFFDREFDIQLSKQEEFMAKIQVERNSKLEEARKNKLEQRRSVAQRLALQKTPVVISWMDKVKANKCLPMANWSCHKPPLITYIFEQLPVSSPLKSLELCNNALSDDCAELLRECLSSNQSIRRLNLAHNRLGPASCFAIGQILCMNRVLQSLSLEGNPLQSRTDSGKQNGIYGIQKLAGSLKVNTTLHNLNLLNSSLTKEGRGQVADAIVQNDGLLVLSLESFDLNIPQQSGIRSKLEENGQRRAINAAAERSRLRREKEAEMARLAEEAKLLKEQQERDFAENNRAERVHTRWMKRREEVRERRAREEQARLEAEAEAEALRLAAKAKKGKKKKGKKKKGKKKK